MPDLSPAQSERALKVTQLAAVLADPTKTASEREIAKAAAKVLVAEGEDQAERDRLAAIVVKAVLQAVPPAPEPVKPVEPPEPADERPAARLALVKSYAAIIGAFASTPQERKDALAMAKLVVASGETQAERDMLSAIVIAAVTQAAKPGPDGYNQLTIEAAAKLERERALKAIEDRKKEEDKKSPSKLAVVGVGLAALAGGAFFLFRK